MMFTKRNNADYLNWIAVGQALGILSGGLRHYAETKMKDVQSLMTSKLGSMKCHCSGIKPNPHENPSTSCIWAKELRRSHCVKKRSRISWCQSDSSKWHDPNDGYWEIAKIFMPDLSSGTNNVKDPNSTDSTGLLNLFYYCKHFNIQKTLIKSVKDCRNKWAHSANQSLQDPDKELAFDTIFNLLDDPELMLYKEVQDCRKEIVEVRTADITILEKNELCILEECWKVHEYLSNHNESRKRKQAEKKMERLIKDQMAIAARHLRNQPSDEEKQNESFTRNNVAILFIGFFFGLLKYGSNGFRWFLLVLMILQVGDKSMLSSDNGCLRAAVKSPISNLLFQEFNFSSYLNFKRYNFFGRKWIFRELETIFENADHGSLGALIIGEPGFGKSAIMSELICSPFSSLLIHNNIIGYHLCVHYSRQKHNGGMFVRNLVDQIASSLPEYSDYISNNKHIHQVLNNRCERYPVDCFYTTIVEPLKELKNQPDRLKYIIIDALDECIENDGTTSAIIEIISNITSFTYFPTWLKFILSSRNWTMQVTDKIPRSFKRFALDSADERNMEDIHFYITQFLFQNSSFMDRLLEAMSLRSTTKGVDSLVNELSKKGGGNFLFIKTTLEYLKESVGRINIQSFPTSLYDTYDIYFKRHFDKEDFNRFKTLFEILIAAPSPLRLSEINSILKVHNESYEASDLIKKLSGILRFGHENTVLIYHQSFAEWLQVKQNDSGELSISKSRGHQYIADHLFVVMIQRGSLPTLKELSQLAVHMLQSKVAEKYVKKLEFINVSKVQDPTSYNCILHELALNDEFSPILDVFLRLFDSADIPNINNFTPAIHAASMGNLENLKLLIKKGVDVNYVVDVGIPRVLYGDFLFNIWRLEDFSMIHVACSLGHTKIVELLIKFNVSGTIASGSGLRPMHLAAEGGHVDSVMVLYNAGVNGDVIALHHAATNNHSNVVSLLLNTLSVRDECLPCSKTCNLPDFEQGTDAEKIHILLRETALHAAVYRRHTEIVKLLLSFGNSTLECQHITGRTALMSAVERNDTEIAELLLNAGANTETNCNHGLAKWFSENKFSIVPTSLESSYFAFQHDYRYSCYCGEKVIHLCAKYGFLEMTKLILEKNANILATDCDGVLSVVYAVLHDHIDFVHHFNRTLVANHDSHLINKAFVHMASWCGSYKTLQLLLTNINDDEFPVVDEHGMTPLHYAVGWSPYPNSSLPQLEICSVVIIPEKSCPTPEVEIEVKRQFTKRLTTVKLLVDSQKDRTEFVDRKDKTGKTSLHYAVITGFVDALKYLVHHVGGDWKARDQDGNTPLTLALVAVSKQPKCFRCFRTYDKLFRICDTTIYDSTVGYLVWLDKSKFKKCDLETANILATAMRMQMPLTLYTLLKIGLDLNCKVGQTQRPFFMHLSIGGQQISEVFKMFEVNVSVKCDVPLRESELHLISHRRVSGDVGNFFKPSVNKRSFPFQRLVSAHQKGFRIFDECRDQSGYLAIHRAAAGGNSDAIEWLINVGVNISLKTTSGLTALDLSIFNMEIFYSFPLSWDDKAPRYVPMHLILEKLLAETTKSINNDWYSSWCNPKLNKLSPLHLAATGGIDSLNIVYNKTRKIVPDISLACYNKDRVGPLYLAHLYDSVDNFKDRKIDTVSLQYPQREVEYEIIYNRFYESPLFMGIDIMKLINPYVDEITNCPDFYSLVPNQETLLDAHLECLYNFSILDTTNVVLRVLPFHLHLAYFKYYSLGSFSLGLFSNTMHVHWLKYHVRKRGLILLWLLTREKLEHLKNCNCVKIMSTLQLYFTRRPRNVRKVEKFIWERMGWNRSSTLHDEKSRWPFYFLFKKAMGEYKSYEYLNILNKRFDHEEFYSFNYHGLYEMSDFIHIEPMNSDQYVEIT